MAHTDNAILRSATLYLRGAPGWEAIVGDALRRIPGVAEVKVDGDGVGLRVRFDPALTSPDQFLNLAVQAGYEAHL